MTDSQVRRQSPVAAFARMRGARPAFWRMRLRATGEGFTKRSSRSVAGNAGGLLSAPRPVSTPFQVAHESPSVHHSRAAVRALLRHDAGPSGLPRVQE